MSPIVKKHTGTVSGHDGTPIYYECRGEGPPLVLCYGIACVMNHWVHQINYFSDRYRLITFDYRGHHRTPAPQDPSQITLTTLTQDLGCILDHLQIPQAGLWGHSFGAQVIAHFYERMPERVRHLVFINGFVKNPIAGMFGTDVVGHLFRYFKEAYRRHPFATRALWRTLVSNPAAVTITGLAGGFNLELTRLKDVEIYTRGLAGLELSAFIPLFESMMNYDGSEVLARAQVPALIIAGERDHVTPLRHQYQMHKDLRGSELTVVPYGSHCTLLDLPEYVNLRIEKFLQQHPLP